MDMSKPDHPIYVACSDQHEHIAREYKPPVEDYQSNIRREMKLEQKVGVSKTQMLVKYEGVTALDKVGAREVLETVFPDAPEAEIARAILLCVNYHLNPLMNHVYLIPFKRKEDGKVVGTDWATVIGRGAKRLMASRRGPYSYIENTPRVMTEEEQMATFGEYDEDKLYCITKLQDPQTGATAVGYGFWPKTKPVYGKPNERVPNQPKGVDKGNSMFNMASGRSETQALDRLRPGEMPMNLPVMDEALAAEAMGGGLDSKDYLEAETDKVTSSEDVKEEPIDGVFTEVKEESTSPEPEPGEKDETPIKEEQILELGILAEKSGMMLADIVKWCIKDKGWTVKKLADLHNWQYLEIVKAFDKGTS